jgi:hypothetical protein
MTMNAAVVQKFGDADVLKYENIETPKPKPGPSPKPGSRGTPPDTRSRATLCCCPGLNSASSIGMRNTYLV